MSSTSRSMRRARASASVPSRERVSLILIQHRRILEQRERHHRHREWVFHVVQDQRGEGLLHAFDGSLAGHVLEHDAAEGMPGRFEREQAQRNVARGGDELKREPEVELQVDRFAPDVRVEVARESLDREARRDLVEEIASDHAVSGTASESPPRGSKVRPAPLDRGGITPSGTCSITSTSNGSGLVNERTELAYAWNQANVDCSGSRGWSLRGCRLIRARTRSARRARRDRGDLG